MGTFQYIIGIHQFSLTYRKNPKAKRTKPNRNCVLGKKLLCGDILGTKGICEQFPQDPVNFLRLSDIKSQVILKSLFGVLLDETSKPKHAGKSLCS